MFMQRHFEFLQKIKKCLFQLGWQVGADNDKLWILFFCCKVYFDQLLALVFLLSCAWFVLA